ncbi:MAG: hypothetical protein KY452_12195 [Actinobacteria bacterium]|nr:hypothetical protein [Actinomycetota bacterium]
MSQLQIDGWGVAQLGVAQPGVGAGGRGLLAGAALVLAITGGDDEVPPLTH